MWRENAGVRPADARARRCTSYRSCLVVLSFARGAGVREVRVRRANGADSSAAVKSATADDDDHWEIVVPVTRVGIAPTV